MKKDLFIIIFPFVVIACLVQGHLSLLTDAYAEQCSPTRPDMLGPFYTPNAPVRSIVGEGYTLSGVVKSSKDCLPIANARIEFWLTGPDGTYNNDHRATIFSEREGRYYFQSNFPPAYFGRPSHIHIRVSASGFKTLITQHYPTQGTAEAIFNLVLISEP